MKGQENTAHKVGSKNKEIELLIGVDILFEISKYLHSTDIFSILRFVCKQWNECILTSEIFINKYKQELNIKANILKKEILPFYYLKRKYCELNYNLKKLFKKSNKQEKLLNMTKELQTREMRKLLVNSLFVLQQEVKESWSGTSTELSTLLFNDNGNYIKTVFYHTEERSFTQDEVYIAFFNINKEFNKFQMNHNKEFNLKLEQTNKQENNIENEDKIKEELKDEFVEVFFEKCIVEGDTSCRIDRGLLQKAMRFMGLSENYVNSNNCVKDFCKFISIHIAICLGILEDDSISVASDCDDDSNEDSENE
ncbi:hypothetical protein ABK040_000697 [Willaertia magna]